MDSRVIILFYRINQLLALFIFLLKGSPIWPQGVLSIGLSRPVDMSTSLPLSVRAWLSVFTIDSYIGVIPEYTKSSFRIANQYFCEKQPH